jgi:3-deoxy-7-phosphoheptulonate synthase
MIIMNVEATEEQIVHVVKEVRRYGLGTDIVHGEHRTVIGLIGEDKKMPFDYFATLPGVKEVMRVETPYKLISREYSKFFNGLKNHNRIVKVGKVDIGGEQPVFIAGPCAVENEEQLLRIAEEVKKAGAHILRGGVYKPRSSVHSFQGLGSIDRETAEQALKWLAEAGREFELATVTEVRGEAHADLVAEYVDILQIGARNMYDQDLLTTVARTGKPILLKRHFGAGIEEFLSFAEYIAAEGNKDIILCERGIVPVGKGREYTRYTLDLTAVPAIQKETYLPIIVDPSHGTGRRDLIFSASCAATAAGASGLMIEVHYNPAEALVDGHQTITPDELERVIKTCREIAPVVMRPESDIICGKLK